MTKEVSIELDIIHRVEEYCPAQILMNSKNYNWTLREYQSKIKNKKIIDLIELRLKMGTVYEWSYSRSDARTYMDLDKTGFSKQYNELEKEYVKKLQAAKNSILDKMIKERDVCYTDVYERLINKRNNLIKKLKSGKCSAMDECNLHNYNIMIDDYNRTTFRKYALFE